MSLAASDFLREPKATHAFPQEVHRVNWTFSPTAVQVQEACETLERGHILFFPRLTFETTEAERELFDPAIVKGLKKRSAVGRLRVVYSPENRRVTKTGVDTARRQTLRSMLDRYSKWARDLVLAQVPNYKPALNWGPTSFRPSLRNRQRVHIDAFFRMPTQGRRVLRVFTNVNPDGVPRCWEVSDTFDTFAPRYAGNLQVDTTGQMLARLALSVVGITSGRQTPYDYAMWQLRNFAKADTAFENMRPPEMAAFPSGSTWMCYTDAILHGGFSGQHAFEQTFMLDPAAMYQPHLSPLSILERLTGRILR